MCLCLRARAWAATDGNLEARSPSTHFKTLSRLVGDWRRGVPAGIYEYDRMFLSPKSNHLYKHPGAVLEGSSAQAQSHGASDRTAPCRRLPDRRETERPHHSDRPTSPSHVLVPDGTAARWDCITACRWEYMRPAGAQWHSKRARRTYRPTRSRLHPRWDQPIGVLSPDSTGNWILPWLPKRVEPSRMSSFRASRTNHLDPVGEGLGSAVGCE